MEEHPALLRVLRNEAESVLVPPLVLDLGSAHEDATPLGRIDSENRTESIGIGVSQVQVGTVGAQDQGNILNSVPDRPVCSMDAVHEGLGVQQTVGQRPSTAVRGIVGVHVRL